MARVPKQYVWRNTGIQKKASIRFHCITEAPDVVFGDLQLQDFNMEQLEGFSSSSPC